MQFLFCYSTPKEWEGVKLGANFGVIEKLIPYVPNSQDVSAIKISQGVWPVEVHNKITHKFHFMHMLLVSLLLSKIRMT